MKKNKIIIALAFSLLGASAFAQSTAKVGTGELKSTAKIENTCIIVADNVNFGQVYAPLTTQGTQSEMRVLCSKDVPFTIALAYGGKYGTGSDNSYKFTLEGHGDSGSSYRLFTATGTYIGIISCWNNDDIEYRTEAVAKVFGQTNKNRQLDSLDLCNRSVLRSSTYGTAYSYGVMNGAMKGNVLAYKITVPGDITKVWNSGNNSYTSKGTGLEQSITYNAQIVPGNSSSLYPAQDMYSDTVTAVISY